MMISFFFFFDFFKYMMICLIDKFAFLLTTSTALYILGVHIFWGLDGGA